MSNPRGFGPLEWTRRYGYLYPASVYPAALVATFGRFRTSTFEICVREHADAQGRWIAASEQAGRAA